MLNRNRTVYSKPHWNLFYNWIYFFEEFENVNERVWKSCILDMRWTSRGIEPLIPELLVEWLTTSYKSLASKDSYEMSSDIQYFINPKPFNSRNHTNIFPYFYSRAFRPHFLFKLINFEMAVDQSVNSKSSHSSWMSWVNTINNFLCGILEIFFEKINSIIKVFILFQSFIFLLSQEFNFWNFLAKLQTWLKVKMALITNPTVNFNLVWTF